MYSLQPRIEAAVNAFTIAGFFSAKDRLVYQTRYGEKPMPESSSVFTFAPCCRT